MKSDLEYIKKLGFKYVGEWCALDENEKITHNIELKQQEQERVIYAFVVCDDVKYVGETTRTLKEKMQNYRTCDESQGRDIENNKQIKKVLGNKDGNKNKVSIYTLCDSSVSSLSDEILSILKYGIISNLNPKKLWNKRGVKNN
ncbi:MAG: hypothetical protein FWF51_12810 [Chitinivibrionia bacterium]|nr:hypothetical protein [Chitinivibrionia bacterium]